MQYLRRIAPVLLLATVSVWRRWCPVLLVAALALAVLWCWSAILLLVVLLRWIATAVIAVSHAEIL